MTDSPLPSPHTSRPRSTRDGPPLSTLSRSTLRNGSNGYNDVNGDTIKVEGIQQRL